jgi:hypothetical protein
MNIIKNYIVPIVLLIAVALVWVGSVLISQKQFVAINPNASAYTKPLKETFDIDLLNAVNERTEKSFPVLPSEFLDLNPEN